jgi:biopolymer transport protein ExbB/TolQ
MSDYEIQTMVGIAVLILLSAVAVRLAFGPLFQRAVRRWDVKDLEQAIALLERRLELVEQQAEFGARRAEAMEIAGQGAKQYKNALGELSKGGDEPD